MSNGEADGFPSVVDLNVGGQCYTTSLETLTRNEDTLLGQLFTGKIEKTDSGFQLQRDAQGKYFLDRDGSLFRYILDYLRTQKLVLPEGFHERERLKEEAEFFQLQELVDNLSLRDAKSSSIGNQLSPGSTWTNKKGYITVGYRGTFAFGRDGLADVKFRKLSRILVSGRVTLCREVFGDSLNESRDPDHGCLDRYTSRFFLKHTFLEQCFDMLQDAGFHCEAACASGTSGCGGELKPGQDSEENRWNHYNEFLFVRP